MTYKRMTLKNAVGLAAPHTWTASVFPVLLGTLLSAVLTGQFKAPVFWLLLCAAVLLQSSVNTFNDYYDFVKGTDLKENSDEPADAVLIYNDIDPKHVLRLGSLYMGTAALFGLYPIYRGGLGTFLLGAVGCLVILAYSAGKHPISYLPLGELVSGGVMGGLLPTAVFSAFAGYIDLRVLPLSVPLIVGIGLIMMTNNTCDIERDRRSGRRTLPALLGRSAARRLYRLLAGVWVLSMLALVLLCFPKGALPAASVLAMSGPALARLFLSPLVPERRGPCMGVVTRAMIGLSCSYLAGIAGHILFE
ncbi:MAG: prenyltransferase [Clostridiales Family XIII bacterium]|jgi:1,4-dihydroxy-2-naphthoate octaprenyltransferase|nr:prenyltransferase [Clostridiales Family XIII bacterium]